MSLLLWRKPKARQRLPRVDNVASGFPVERQSTVSVAHAEEARRVALRHLEQETSIVALTEEVNTWRGRASAAEAQLQKMFDRERQLLALIDEVNAGALRKNEHFTETLTVVKTQFVNASRLLLAGFATINAVTGSSSAKVNLNAPAEALGKKLDGFAAVNAVTGSSSAKVNLNAPAEALEEKLDGFAAVNAVNGSSRARIDLEALAEALEKKEVLSVVPQDDPRPAPETRGGVQPLVIDAPIKD